MIEGAGTLVRRGEWGGTRAAGRRLPAAMAWPPRATRGLAHLFTAGGVKRRCSTPRIMLAHLFTAGGVKRRCMAAQFWRTRSPARAEGEGLFNTSSSVGACLYHTALCGCASAAASAAAGSSTGGARGLPSAPRRRSLRTDGQRCRKSTGKRMDQERCVWQSTGLCGDAR